ncbi:ATP-binding cassette domain-containing protein [Fructobacillus sp. W13]|uniref:ATP-binding cassette domain-containing protein n=1 Tax=Fructobacillus apis TaxID=2935017 RepID=A0ABT0ZR56_9LACO|nr:ATP-binding cassette domain-containing protein [Fructobacillus apis]MCO0832433.1 ATP-binding cassette domain-containing protein [Fructobacillus apis]
MGPLLEIKNLKVYYAERAGFFNQVVDYIRAVDDISLTIEEGKTYGLVGQSGSGKSTIGKIIVGLEEATEGSVSYKGQDVTTKKQKKALNLNKDVQMVFQDSQSSLNPRKTIGDILAEPLKNFGVPNKIGAQHSDADRSFDPDKIDARIRELLAIVGLPERTITQYPFQFSGGQRQRIVVARALATNPKLIVADEPVSALDLSVQAQVLNFMKEIQKTYGISFLFISHDLGVVRYMTDNIAIMHHGRFVEVGTTDEIFENPQHIYTKRLLASIPSQTVAGRKAKREERIAVEKEFDENRDRYYEENSDPLRAYDLVKLTDTHAVSIQKEDEES